MKNKMDIASLDTEKSKIDNLTPGERAKYSILGNRLNLSRENTQILLQKLKEETARTFLLPDAVVSADVDLFGREFDLVFTINKDYTPKNNL